MTVLAHLATGQHRGWVLPGASHGRVCPGTVPTLSIIFLNDTNTTWVTSNEAVHQLPPIETADIGRSRRRPCSPLRLRTVFLVLAELILDPRVVAEFILVFCAVLPAVVLEVADCTLEPVTDGREVASVVGRDGFMDAGSWD